MLSDLIVEFRDASACPPQPESTKCMAAISIWGFSVAEILKLVAVKALELGREYRSDIEQAAKIAVDHLVAMDIPFVPDSIEGKIDQVTRDLGYAAIVAILDAVLAKQS